MPTRIHFNEAKLLESYEQMMDKVYLQYFTHPSEIPHFDLSESEIAEIAEHTAMANAAGRHGHGKKVIFQRDDNWHNGMPRKQR